MSSTAVRPLTQAHAAASLPRGAATPWMAPLRLWHLLSLDAPTVAAVWLAAFLTGAAGRNVLPQAAALFVAVWLFYAGDRVLDAALQDSSRLEARHRFHGDHLPGFAAGAAVAVPLLVWLLARVPQPTLAAWLWLAVPMAGYALAVHGSPVGRVPKEAIVALMFTVATALPALLVPGSDRGRTLLFALLFGAVCWLNCMAIARWEGERPTAGVAAAAAVVFASQDRVCRWGVRHLRILLVAVLCAGVASLFFLSFAVAKPALACALSALLLLLLDRRRAMLEPVTLRALADAALLTPLLFTLLR